MLTTGTSAEVKASTRIVSRSLTAPSPPPAPARGSGCAGLGGVGVGVVLDEGGHDLAAGLPAVLRDALLALGVAVGVAHGPVRQRDVGTVGERLAVLGRPRGGDELVLEGLALELGRDRLHLGELLVVLGDGLVVPEDVVAVLEVVHQVADLGA